MEQMQGGAPQQKLLVRMYQPDMALLRATAKQMQGIPGLKLGMYGQGGEVLIVAAAQGVSQQAAAQIAQSAVAQLEAAMGDCVYGRGQAGLAHVAATLLQKDESELAAADFETGSWLEPELKTTPLGRDVFDFGAASYNNEKMADKILDTAIMDEEETQDPVQQAADRSYAAAKCTKCEFGAAITGTSQPNSPVVCAAVTYGKYVYVRCIRPAQDAGKAAALSILDIIRRLCMGLPVPYARTFKAGHQLDWNQPEQPGAAGAKGGKKKSGALLPVAIVLLTIVLLGGAGWLLYQRFVVGDADSGALPADASMSMSVAADDGTATSGAQSTADGTAADAAQSTPTAQAAGNGENTTGGGPVYPFA